MRLLILIWRLLKLKSHYDKLKFGITRKRKGFDVESEGQNSKM